MADRPSTSPTSPGVVSIVPGGANLPSIRQYLRSNVPPPETASFRSIVQDGELRLANANARIRDLEDDVEALRRQRDALEAYVDTCRSIFSPIRRLPPELLSAIFELCTPPLPARKQGLPEQGSPEVEIQRIARPHLLRLAQVSCHWRQIALGTPSLWSNIAVETAMWAECPLPPELLLEFIRTALTRSGNHPLCVRLIAETNDDNSTAVFELLAPHSLRWKEADIRISKSQIHLLDPIRGRLPILEKLGLHTRAETVDMFREAPRLKEMIFWGFSTCRLNIPWTGVDVFRACGGPMETSTSLSFMSSLPQGSSAYFYINAQRMPSSLMLLPCVTSLVRRFGVDIGCCHDAPTGQFAVQRIWDSLTFKHLNHLHLKARRTHPAPLWHHASFQALALRSGFGAGLISLTLRTRITELELLETLASLPALEKLDLTDLILADPHFVLITDSLLRRLVWDTDDDTTHILPNLQRVYLRSLLHFSDAVFVDFVRSRSRWGYSGFGFAAASAGEGEGEEPAKLTFLSVNYAAERKRNLGKEVAREMRRVLLDSAGVFKYKEGPLAKGDYS